MLEKWKKIARWLGQKTPGKLQHRIASGIPPDQARAAFPTIATEKEQKLACAQMIIGICLTGLLMTLVLLITAGIPRTTDRAGDNLLERSAYGEKNHVVTYELEAERDQETVSGQIRIPVPVQDPDARTTEIMLDEAEAYVKTFLEQYTQYAYQGSFPTSYGDVMITCIPENFQWIDASGSIRWELIDTPVQVSLQILLSAYGVERDCTYTITLIPGTPDLHAEVEALTEAVQSGAFTEDTQVSLPASSPYGTRFNWTPIHSRGGLPLWGSVLILLVVPGLLVLIVREKLKEQVENRKKRILHAYPDMLNKLMILLGSGIHLIRAWEMITEDYRRKKMSRFLNEPLYEDMIQVESRYRTGISFPDSIRIFADETGIGEIRQFAAILQISWRRGDEQLLLHLKELNERSWEIRRNQTRKRSEEADTKLLIPMIMMLIVVIMIVLSPAIMTMK